MPYLRLGDAYLKHKDAYNAWASYAQAVRINPTLLSGKSFAKTYKNWSERPVNAAGRSVFWSGGVFW